jgi:hypothetical protein
MAGSRRKDRRLAHSPGPLNRPVVRDRRRRPCRKLDGGDERRDREVIETLPDHPEGSVWFALHQSPAGGQLEPMEPRNAERKSCAGRKSDSKARLTGNPIISPPSTATALSHGRTPADSAAAAVRHWGSPMAATKQSTAGPFRPPSMAQRSAISGHPPQSGHREAAVSPRCPRPCPDRKRRLVASQGKFGCLPRILESGRRRCAKGRSPVPMAIAGIMTACPHRSGSSD